MLTPMKNITICENTVTIKSTYKDENQEAKDLAFESLEKLRKKFSDLDYDKELAEYREGKYENLS